MAHIQRPSDEKCTQATYLYLLHGTLSPFSDRSWPDSSEDRLQLSFHLHHLYVERNQLRVLLRTEDLYHTEGLDEATREILGIHTYYENQWIERGLNIRYMKFELPHEGELTEPDVEIPLDEYRSYHRTKRSSKDTAK